MTPMPVEGSHERRSPWWSDRSLSSSTRSEGVFTVDEQWRIPSFNRAAERITGIPRDRALGKPCKDIFRANICETECSLRQTIETGTPIIGKRIAILDGRGTRRTISICTAILRDENGSVAGGVETFRDLTGIDHLRKQIRRHFRFEDIVSSSPRTRELFALPPDVAESSSTVLIEGETGTGKELVSRAIHNHSHRREKPFVAVNRGALPDTLLASELFGYKAGAFTDARKDKPGRFAAAEGGTLFLDEIGDVSPRIAGPLTACPAGENVRAVGLSAASQGERPDRLCWVPPLPLCRRFLRPRASLCCPVFA